MWDVLEIARTTDKAVIRKAYAAKLRTIDSDRDPAAFVRLREAYEAALAWSSRPKSRLRTVADRAAAQPEGVTPAIPLPTAPPLKPELPPAVPPRIAQIEEDARDFADFELAVAQKRTLDAERCLHRLMARGLIGIGLEAPPMRRVAELALHDFTLSADVFARIVGRLGFADIPPSRDNAPELRRRIGYRLVADAWLSALRVTAAKRPWGKARDDVQVARLFIGRKRIGGLPGLKSGRLVKSMEEYQRHLPWSSQTLDAGRMAAIDAKLKRAVRRQGRWEKFYLGFAYIIVGFLVLDFLWVLFCGQMKWGN